MPVAGTRVSPLFDVARTVLLADIEGGEFKNRSSCDLRPGPPLQRAVLLRNLGVNTLVCGGISTAYAMLVQAQGIRLVPWVAGEVEEVLQAYVAGRLARPEFMMPGCCHRRRRGGWGRGRGRGRAGMNW